MFEADIDPQRVALDVTCGYVSAVAAERDYSVLLDGHGVADEVATAAERERRRREGDPPHFAFGLEREAHEAVWTAAVYAELTVILARMPVHWRFLLVQAVRIAAPLRLPARSHDRTSQGLPELPA